MSVRIAILDSGVHAGHPHVGEVAGGFDATGLSGDFLDRIGHGTAVAGAIRSHAPEAEIYAVKIFERSLRTNMEILLRGIEWALGQGVDYLNLSLGTSNEEHASSFGPWIERGAVWVSAADAYPGKLAGVVGVAINAALERDQVQVLESGVYVASPHPREIPGVPKERNLSGISFAVANVTGLLASGAIPGPQGRGR
jgi:subtilisin family serine protease